MVQWLPALIRERWPETSFWERFLPLEGDDDSGEELHFDGDPPEDFSFQLLDSKQKDLKVALLRNFLDKQQIETLHKVAKDPSVAEIDDRAAGLTYKHHVWRLEKQLHESDPDLYERILNAAWSVDAKLWKNLRDRTIFPEIEYIVYDVEKLGEHGTINRHTDNQSQVSMVILLSDPQEFKGGVNCFEGDGGTERRVELRKGDCVFFYGDECTHWITPVSAGRRVILQMELSRGWPACPAVLCGLCDWMVQ
jgi:hypothetical protein